MSSDGGMGREVGPLPVVRERTFRARVIVRLREGVNDPQGNAVAQSLATLGYADLGGVRVGRVIDLRVTAADDGAARARVGDACAALLANPVIETWEVDVLADMLDVAPVEPG